MLKPAVQTLTAKVYKAGKRRFLTKRAAYIAVARQMLKRACPDGCGTYDDHPYGSGTAREYHWCHRHNPKCERGHEWCTDRTHTYEHRLTRRLARWLQWKDSCQEAVEILGALQKMVNK